MLFQVLALADVLERKHFPRLLELLDASELRRLLTMVEPSELGRLFRMIMGHASSESITSTTPEPIMSTTVDEVAELLKSIKPAQVEKIATPEPVDVADLLKSVKVAKVATPEPATPTPEPEPATPTPEPEPATPTPEPDAPESAAPDAPERIATATLNTATGWLSIQFDDKPSEEVITEAKANGFNAKRRGRTWYWKAKRTDAREALAERYAGEVEHVHIESKRGKGRRTTAAPMPDPATTNAPTPEPTSSTAEPQQIKPAPERITPPSTPPEDQAAAVETAEALAGRPGYVLKTKTGAKGKGSTFGVALSHALAAPAGGRLGLIQLAFSGPKSSVQSVIANLQLGRRAAIVGDDDVVEVETQKEERWTVERRDLPGGNQAVSMALKRFCEIEAAPGDSAFVLSPPTWWVDEQEVALSGRAADPRELAVASMFAGYLDRRTSVPILQDPEFCLRLWRRAQELGLFIRPDNMRAGKLWALPRPEFLEDVGVFVGSHATIENFVTETTQQHYAENSADSEDC